MNSATLIWILFAAYMLIALVAACERNWARASYFICAGGISLSVLAMGEW